MKKILSAIMALLLLVSTSASFAQEADPPATGTFYDCMADPSTLDSWTELFKPNSTKNVGTIWSDKTVTTAVPSDSKGTYDFEMQNSGTNFMVTLSTLSSTMSITGHETLPTDTVFVLDLSSSMYSSGVSIVDKMVDAVNAAIDKLLNLNPLNRVGVVIYYGGQDLNPQATNQHAKIMIPLANYNPLESGKYIKWEGSTSVTGISVYPDLTASDGKYEYGTHSTTTVAGTYIQLGLELAQDMFRDADTTIPADAEFQAGAARIPILVLMSDGEPTAATEHFSDVSSQANATMGNNSTGERSPAESDFLTQLTAGLTREVMDRHYVDTVPLFYTLGLGNSISDDVMDPYNTDIKWKDSTTTTYNVSTGRSNNSYQNSKEEINRRIHSYWTNLLAGKAFKLTYLHAGGRWGTPYSEKSTTSNVQQTTFTLDDSSFDFPNSLKDKYYVDKYFPAATADDLSEAFTNLIHEIELQSAYYPTYVENGAIGMSGYIDFHDEIGDMMEVRKVHGLARRATQREIANIEKLEQSEREKIRLEDGVIYYRGEQIAEHFQDNMYASTVAEEDKAEITRVMTTLFQKRLNMNEAQAHQLLNQIISNQAIYHKKDDDYSNSFSWYAEADEDFISLVTAKNESTPPSGARYKITSYWYASPYDLENTNSFIRIKRDLATTKECVTWSVPASMIPLVRYEVTLPQDQLVNSDGIKVVYRDNFPMRAFFEVGLRSDINRYNAVEKLEAANYKPDSNGVYTFFSNAWDADQINPDAAPGAIHNAGNTVSTFKPSEQNERYFITSDLPLYKKNSDGNYSIYKGNTRPSGNDYYVRPTLFEVKDGQWQLIEDNYVALSGSYEADQPISNGPWYVDIRTPRYPDVQQIPKNKNLTESFGASTYEPAHVSGMTHVISILGNNGTFHFTADTGMSITKKINAEHPNTDDVFTFVIEPAPGNTNKLSGDYAINYHKDGVFDDSRPTSITAVDGKITVEIHHGETAYIAGHVVKTGDLPGLPIGEYVVTEKITGKDGKFFYEVDGVAVGDKPSGSSSSNIIDVTNMHVTEVEYTNIPVDTGAIEISKAVTAGEGLTAPDATFTFQVKLNEQYHGGNKIKKQLNGGAEEAFTVPADGVFTVQLKAGETVRYSGLAARQEVDITVTEINLPDGFTVVGDAGLTKTISSNQTISFPFTNKYDAQPTEVTFSGTKTLEGRDLKANEFTFELYETGADFAVAESVQPIRTANNGANGSFAFDKLTYTKPGTHHYVVKESGTVDKVTNDTTVYQITVVVADKGGKLAATVTGADADNLNFTNRYTPDGITVPLSGTKTLTGRDLKDGEFSFELYRANENFAAEGDALQTVQNGANGTFAFASLPFDAAGTYRYVVREVPGTAAGVTYDDTEYHVAITVTYNSAEGKFESSTAITRADDTAADALNFANSYIPADAQVTLSGLKTLAGRDLKEGEFTFQLFETDADFAVAESAQPIRTATNGADGKYAFPALTYKVDQTGTYRYVVKETGTVNGVTNDATVYRVVVTVAYNSVTGELTATPVVTRVAPDNTTGSAAHDALNFANTYIPANGSVTLTGTKTLEGRALKDDEFSFDLFKTGADFTVTEGATPIQTKTNTGSAFAFDAISYDEESTHYYVIREQNTSLGGVTYDTTEHHITVTVTDNLNGQLEATVTGIPEGGIAFRNSYKPAGTSVPLSATKTLAGRPLNNGEFTFQFFAASLTDGQYTADKLLQTVTNAADGTISFADLSFDKVGEFHYIIREASGVLPGVTYDTTEHHLTVTVTDNLNGQLEATVTGLPEGGIAFRNSYKPAGTSVPLSATKTLAGRPLNNAEFTFQFFAASLTDGQYTATGEALQTVTNAADGTISFADLSFTEKGEFHYIIREASGSLPGVTYDTTEHHITVTVTDNLNGQLVANVTGIPEGGIAFRNSYKPTETSFAFSGKKTLEGRGLKKAEFSFSLYKAALDDNSNFVTGELIETVRNAEDGTFAFATLENISAIGTYYYVVKEDAGNLPGVTYDETEYHITVNVTDENGALKPEANVVAVNPNAPALLTVHPDAIPLTESTLNFTNHYAAEDTEVVFSGVKTITGRTLKDNEFSFELFETGADFAVAEGATPIETVTNKDGKFTFTALPYNKEGTWYYVIREVDNNLSGVTYDTTEHHITITVKDENAELVPTVTGIPEGGIVFSNKYEASDAYVLISGVKTLTVPEGLTRKLQPGEFSFALYAANQEFTISEPAIETVSNDVNGAFAFKKLEYDKAGVYHYVVKEVPGELPGVTYDTTEYHITVTVTDRDSTGQLVPVATCTKHPAVVTFAARPANPIEISVDELGFTNEYAAEDTEVVFSGVKTLTGRDLKDDEFSFELFETGADFAVAEDATPIETVTNKDGKFTFTALPYDEEGTWYYVIREVDNNLAGVTYDATEHHLTVTVTDENAELVPTVTGIPEGGIAFRNSYEASDAYVLISGVKTLTVPEGLTRKLQPGEFSFALYAANQEFTISEPAIETVSNDVNGAFAFKKLEYDKAGVYHYVVKEVPGELPGVTYDTTEYHITVTVTDRDSTGQLVPVATCTKHPAVVTFAARPADPIEISVDELVFTNEYAAEDTEVVFSGVKTITGRNLNEGEFKFSLYAADSSFAVAEGATPIQTVTNAADGTFSFAAVPFTVEGTWHFVVLEEAGDYEATTYDPTRYLITVVVTDSAAQLEADVSVTVKDALPGAVYSPDGLDFLNVHDETDAEILFSGKKTYHGHSLAEGEFSFTLFAADDSFNALDPIETVTNAKDGTFAFQTIVYDKIGMYHYIVREEQGDKPYILYDQAEYRIAVEVWNDDGVLKTTVEAVRVLGEEIFPVEELLANGFAFENRYVPSSAAVEFPGMKLFPGAELAEGMFTFHLYAADHNFQPVGKPLDTAVNKADGSFAFTPRTFRSAGVYHFLVVEDTSSPLPGVSYDTTVYHITVTVTDNGYGRLIPSVHVETSEGLAAEQPVFENRPWKVPDTGDAMPLEAMLALCLFSLSALIFLSRRRAHS